MLGRVRVERGQRLRRDHSLQRGPCRHEVAAPLGVDPPCALECDAGPVQPPVRRARSSGDELRQLVLDRGHPVDAAEGQVPAHVPAQQDLRLPLLGSAPRRLDGQVERPALDEAVEARRLAVERQNGRDPVVARFRERETAGPERETEVLVQRLTGSEGQELGLRHHEAPLDERDERLTLGCASAQALHADLEDPGLEVEDVPGDLARLRADVAHGHLEEDRLPVLEPRTGAGRGQPQVQVPQHGGAVRRGPDRATRPVPRGPERSTPGDQQVAWPVVQERELVVVEPAVVDVPVLLGVAASLVGPVVVHVRGGVRPVDPAAEAVPEIQAVPDLVADR